MKKCILLYYVLVFISFAHAQPIDINDTTNSQEILQKSKILIDHSRELLIDDIINSSDQFKATQDSRLSFGYSPDFNVWIKFSLHNNADHSVTKILEYANPLTTHLELFDPQNQTSYKDGLFQLNPIRKSVNPYFELTLKANETKTYYIKASSTITTLIVELKLSSSESFFNNELKHQSILQLFFGAMFILALYNFFVWLFTKDISYLFYVLYILGVLIHHLMYTGVAYIYFLTPNTIELFIQYASFIVAFPIYLLGFFTKYFIKLQKYPTLNKLLTYYLIIFPFISSIFIFTDQLDKYRNIFTVILLIFLIYIAIYTAIKRNRQAYFIVFGWLIMFLGSITMYLSSTGYVDIYQYFPYIVELTFLSEALLFSIALADKINHLQKERDAINKTLITQQKTEKKRLALEVKNKTKELNLAVQQQTNLLKELNHRVKNNMQTIVSLVRLQADEIDNDTTKDAFLTIQNRISAMSHLHELLYKQSDVQNIRTHEYFDTLVDNLLNSYEIDANITFNIKTDLKVEPAISCGLILNELIVNSFKYAFDETINDPKIVIELYKKDDTFHFNIEDNGIGYDLITKTNSFGLILVSSLVEEHLEGTIQTFIDKGVKNYITWEDTSELQNTYS